MKKSPPKNLAASVRRRLMNYASAHGEPFQSMLTRYAMERLLYRISRSSAADRFVLKGALLFQIWSDHPHRATKDIDLLGFGAPSIRKLADLFRSLCTLAVPADGMEFLADTVTADEIRQDNVYGGVRVCLTACLEDARIPMQVDIGFGDALTPPATEADFPVILDFPAPRLRVYPPEAVIAEKLHALVVLDIANSRMKDIFDLQTLGRQFAFTAGRLAAAIQATFDARGTPLPRELPPGMARTFAEDTAKKAQWNAFLRRQQLAAEDLPLEDVIAFIASFLWPILEAAGSRTQPAGNWPPGGPWFGLDQEAAP
jgi:hypothetical protein